MVAASALTLKDSQTLYSDEILVYVKLLFLSPLVFNANNASDKYSKNIIYCSSLITLESSLHYSN